MTTYLLDVNVLIALSVPTHQHHRAASKWLDNGSAWATTSMTEAAYVRLMSNPRVIGYDVTSVAAVNALATMRGLSNHSFIPDATSLADPLIDVARLPGSQQVTDFHLVNLAASVGAVLATFDGRLLRSLHPDDRGHVLLLTD